MSDASPSAVDAFEAAYTAPALDVVSAAPAEAEREAREGSARAEPDQPFALRGCVLTPDEVLDDAWVVVSGGTVADVRTSPPADANVVETEAIVLPGLVDLHGHPEYNVFSAWEPPFIYANRYEWRGSPEYAAVVKEPWRLLAEEEDGRSSLLPTLTRYAEARALVGGVTALQGASSRYPDASESLVRNVDRFVFGAQRARSLVDLGRASPNQLDQLRAGISRGDVRALYVHVAEGTDEASRAELDQLAEAGLLTPATVVIHGTALDESGLRRLADAGAKLVWSAQSNLRLYGRTTDVATARRLGVPVALGADWLPSGSPSLLDELQVARRVLVAQGGADDPRSLVRMVTSEAARIAGLDDKLGRVRAGGPADLIVLDRHHADPWESVLRSDRRSVSLVTIGGDVAYGRPDWVERLVHPPEVESVVAWGRPMALHLGYSVLASDAPAPRLADLRAAVLARHPAAGPVFA